MSKVCALYHLVFATRSRKRVISMDCRRDLYGFIFTILKDNNCWVDRINGMSDHVHIAFDLNPKISLSSMVQKIKQSTSLWLKANGKFPGFDGWGKGYYAYTYSVEERKAVIDYIKNQESHHLTQEFIDEMKIVALKHNFQWFDDDWD